MPDKFYVDRPKWLFRNLKTALLYAFVAAMFWGFFNLGHEVYAIVFAVLFACASLVMILRGILTRPELRLGNGRLKFGNTDFAFADVVDVHSFKDNYTFFLSTRRRVTVKLSDFSQRDKKEIDGILAEECKKYLAAPGSKEKIAAARDTSVCEFSVRARHSGGFFGLLVFLTVILVFCLLAVIFVITERGNEDVQGIFIAVLLGILIVWAVCLVVEIRLPRDIFSYKDGVFTVERGKRVLKTVRREDVAGVRIPNDFSGTSHITFRIKGTGKKIVVQLAFYRHRDQKYIKNMVRSIFFLPDAETPSLGIKKPFGF